MAKSISRFMMLLLSGMLAAAPLHHWDFSQAKNGRVPDRGSSPQDAVYSAPLAVDATGITLPGEAGSTLVVEDFDASGLEEAFTFAFWFQPRSVSKIRLFGKPYTINPSWLTPQPGFLANASGMPMFAAWGNGSKEKMTVEGERPLVPGAWVHFAATYDGKNLCLYQNGVLIARSPGLPRQDVGKGPFFIGRIKEDDRHFKGRLGTLTIEARAWTAEKIAKAFESESPRYPREISGVVRAFPTEPFEYRVNPKDAWSKGQITPFHALKEYPRQAATVKLDKYGGTLSRTEKATGFFRVQRIEGRWWLITPEGHPYIHKAVVAVSPNGGKTAREYFGRNFENNYQWANRTADMLLAFGFNGAGAWSSVAELAQASNRVAVPLIKNFMSDFGKKKKITESVPGHTGYAKEAIPIFDPDFESFAASYAVDELKSYRNDPWLLGVFSDNELQYPKLVNYLALDPGVPAQEVNRAGAQAWLDEAVGKKGASKADITGAIQARFHAWVLARYYRIVGAAIHKALPDHLYLGSRLHSAGDKENPLMWEAIGPFVDLISVNYYGDLTPDPDMVPMWTAKSGKPVIITEWYVKGDDVGFPNTTGAGWIVRTQRDRGLWYQHFALGLLAMKNVVGWHWFKYMDNDPDDPNAEASNRDSNKGIVKTDWSVYSEPAGLMKDINVEVYPLIQWLDGR